MVLFDMMYTYVYTNAAPRNKYQYILQQKPQTIDLVFLGSSRTANHIVTKEVRILTGKSAINLGMEGALLEDNLLEFKLLLDRKIKMKTLFLQVDYMYEPQDVSNVANVAAFPFICNPIIKEYLKNQLSHADALEYIPFYRYLTADHAIGFREFMLSAANKKGKVDMADGFSPKKGSRELIPSVLPAKISNGNAALDSFALLCRNNDIQLFLFCAPFCSQTGNIEYIDKLKTKLPQLHDYSRTFDDEHFYNCAHLNDEGAKLFTRLLTHDFLKANTK